MADDTRLSEVLASILERRERGEAVDPEVEIRAHPDLADELRVHFAAAQFVDEALAGLGPAGAAPERIGVFRVERELGSGGMGTVWAATAEESVPGVRAGERVALKVVHPHLLRRPGFFRRFVREAEIGSRVRHENVVRTLFVDAALEGETPCHFLAMEYVEGQTLRDLLAEVERVPEELCRHIGREIAKGLAAIHGAGVVHRDLKPENVIISRCTAPGHDHVAERPAAKPRESEGNVHRECDHVVKVMDLGVAQLQDEAIRLSQTGAFVGSLHYAAPEQIDDREHVDGRADLHGLGLVLYELATGKHPFGDGDARSVLRKVLDETPRRCAEINPQLSPFFEEVVHTLLAKDPAKRFESAGSLLAVLEEGERSAWWKDRAKAIRAATKRPLRRVRIPRETALYGREAELAKLRSLWERAKAGEGNVLLVEGEAGIGKSRLVDEFVGLLQQEGEDLHFLFGSSPPGGAATASGAFSTAYREQFGDAGSAPYLGQTPLLVPAFDALLRGEPAPAGTEPLTKDSLQTVFVHATRNLAAERPTIVLIDDLHFAPEEGRALFASLALAVPGHRVLLVGTMRPGVPERWTANVTRLGQTTHLTLPRLGPKDLAHLLRDAFRSEHLANELALRIAEKSDGNPFFVFEIIRGLREGHFLRQRPDGTWETTQILRDITVPSSVLDLVNARVADLADDERNLLDVAACVGFEFDAGLVGDALGMARVPVLQAMAKIEKRHRLVRASGRVFVFDHHQVREALYAALPEPLREEYHAAIADALERRRGAAGKDPKDLEGGLCVDLAEHFLKGAQGTRALRYLDAALTHCEQNYLNEDAVRLAERALAAPGLLAGAERVTVLLRLAGRLDLLGRRDDQRSALDRAVELADADGDPGMRAAVRCELGGLLNNVSMFDAALAVLEEAAALARVAGDRRLEARAAGGTGNALSALGRPEAAREHHALHLALAREAGDRDGEARAIGNLARTLFELGMHAEAIDHYERHLGLARALGDRRGEGNSTGGIGNVLWQLGRHEEALERHAAHREIALAIGDRRGEAAATMNAGLVLQATGREDEARDILERGLRIAREIGARHFEINGLGCLANLLSGQGRTADARSLHEQRLAIARQVGDRRGEANSLGNLGAMARSLGRLAEARGLLEEAVELARTSRDRYSLGYWLFHLAQVASDEGDLAAALRLGGESLDVRRAVGDGDGEAMTRIDLGRLCLDARRYDEARTHLQHALSMARERSRSGHALLASLWLAQIPGADASLVQTALDSHESAGFTPRGEARFLLWQATHDRAHLVEAKRHLDFLVEHAPPECRESMLTNVRLHREIVAAAKEAGL